MVMVVMIFLLPINTLSDPGAAINIIVQVKQLFFIYLWMIIYGSVGTHGGKVKKKVLSVDRYLRISSMTNTVLQTANYIHS